VILRFADHRGVRRREPPRVIGPCQALNGGWANPVLLTPGRSFYWAPIVSLTLPLSVASVGAGLSPMISRKLEGTTPVT
jgi:hypothetical protein